MRRAIALLGMSLLFGGNAATGQPATVPPPIDQARADCTQPQYASDRLVCGDAELLAIDADVGILAETAPVLADGAVWEDQRAWLRRRSLCAFKNNHRGCLAAAYADRHAVLSAARAQTGQSMACGGVWQGRVLKAGTITPGQPVTFSADAGLLGVATPWGGSWQPVLAWRQRGPGIRLKTQDGKQFDCRPALP